MKKGIFKYIKYRYNFDAHKNDQNFKQSCGTTSGAPESPSHVPAFESLPFIKCTIFSNPMYKIRTIKY